MPSLHTVKYLRITVVTVWGVAVGGGTLFLEAYQARPGAAVPAAGLWPEGSSIPRDARRPTLLIFLHPRCTCSLATLGELADVLERCGDRVSAQAVLLDIPLLASSGRSEVEQALAGLPRIAIHRDPKGREARRFHVTTSGHVMLFDLNHRLVYSGGITAARAHRGDNYGRAALLRWVLGEVADRRQTCVFGCPIAAAQSTGSQDSQP